MLQAYASVLDRRNNDLVQVSDDTPRIVAAPGAPVSYYISGVGRIEIPESNTHWRTDLSFYNSSSSARPLILEYHYTPAGSTEEKVVLTRITVEPGQVITADDIVGNDAFLDGATADDLKTGTILGLLKVSYNVPLDGAPLIIGGRIYADLSTGTAGMQLSTYTADESITPGSNGVLVMPGAQTNLRFRTNIGIFAQGDEPTPVEIKAIKQDGSEAATFTYHAERSGPLRRLHPDPDHRGHVPGDRRQRDDDQGQDALGKPDRGLHRHRGPDLDGHGLHPGQARPLRPLEFLVALNGAAARAAPTFLGTRPGTRMASIA